jgi:tetratricopeptide (TPR) repeat protein
VSEKMTRKELRGPDALQRAGLEARHWMEGREKLLVGAVVVLLLGGLAVALGVEISQRGESEAHKDLGAAFEPVTRPVAEDGKPPADAPPGLEKPFATEKEKDEAIVASLSKFHGEHKGTASAATAALSLGQAYHRLGRFDEALASFKEYADKAPKNEPLRAIALEGMGYAYEAKGDLDNAFKAFDELSKLDKSDFLDGMGQFHKARILILQNKKEDAARALSEIPPAFPNTAAARMATERMNVLASQGVTIPAPLPVADAGTGS